ncbi:helix-turn-helix domain-containing protein [Ruminococcus albus]|uniref:Peptidase S24-like protein n=1 Tax=Ruminococcus albus 8 TaxID=246199 RepID=E9SCJ6_RUMAL|nr:XRE family transcriptional regulator [Ruminococcus albus]EGC03057.1 peptidase S24-like protein [Ruminococcus albus 8]MCC3352351.1 XRE family transcriptional regulator [Ruminococcus albus 8]
MEKNVEIGKRIKKRREELGMTQEALGSPLGFNKSTIQRYEAGKVAKIKLPIIEAMAQRLNVSPEWLALKSDDMGEYHGAPDSLLESKVSSNVAAVLPQEKIHMIPVFGSVAAGFGAYASSDVIGYIPLYIENDFDVVDTICIIVKGQSMYPKIEDGDRIVVRRQDSVDNGRVAVVMIGDEAVVKRVNFDGERLELTSFNPEYPPRIIEGEELANCHIVGLVQQVIKAL